MPNQAFDITMNRVRTVIALVACAACLPWAFGCQGQPRPNYYTQYDQYSVAHGSAAAMSNDRAAQTAGLDVALAGLSLQHASNDVRAIKQCAVDCRSEGRDFEASFFAIFRRGDQNIGLDYDTTAAEPVLRSGIIVVRRWRPIIRGKEGGAASFGTTFGLVSFDRDEARNNAPVTAHYELYMRHSPTEAGADGADKHLVRWFRNASPDRVSTSVDLTCPGMWVLTRSDDKTGTFEVIGPRRYGDWKGLPECVFEAGMALADAMHWVVQDEPQ